MKNILFLLSLIAISSCKVKEIKPDNGAPKNTFICGDRLNTIEVNEEKYYDIYSTEYQTEDNKYHIMTYNVTGGFKWLLQIAFTGKPEPGEYTIVSDSLLSQSNQLSLMVNIKNLGLTTANSGKVYLFLDGGYYFVQFCDIELKQSNFTNRSSAYFSCLKE
jgi:hypothetical protein